jgi:hypothetical protein
VNDHNIFHAAGTADEAEEQRISHRPMTKAATKSLIPGVFFIARRSLPNPGLHRMCQAQLGAAARATVAAL